MRWQERIFPISSVNLSGSQEITANNEIALVQSKTAGEWKILAMLSFTKGWDCAT